MQGATVGSAVRCPNTNEDVVGRLLCVLDKYVEISTLIEHPGVEQFVLRIVSAPAKVLRKQLRIRKCCLRVLVQHLCVGMRRRAIEVEIALFDVLSMIPLSAGKTVQTLFQDWVSFVPQCKRKAERLMTIAKTTETIFVPAISTAARLIVREMAPGGSICTVVFTHRTPPAFAEVRPPLFPIHMPCPMRFEPFVFRR